MASNKKKMQDVRFQNMSELLAYLPENQLVILEHLRELIFETVPHIKERLSFNVPFYKKHKGICYIWPGAVAWGSKTLDGVEFGFNYGYLLTDENNYLDRGNRKQVYSKRFRSIEEINEEIICAYLLEATENDEIIQQRNHFFLIIFSRYIISS
ncbi:MAG: DUF1801 domain-containing protein, partial [Bacteroidota bacterium]